MIGIQIGAKSDSGFDDPLGMLKDCHRRIESFLWVLCHVAERNDNGVLSAEEKSAVESALEYFRSGGTRHNRDEEDSVFPRLQGAVARESLETIDRLESDHRAAGGDHAVMDSLFSKWIASGSLHGEERRQLRATADRLSKLYAEHIRTEEEVIFPCAAEVLNREMIAEIGEEFRARRL
jgi:iron-sulfur cluster repair protein YtfE (RIC family)